MYCSTIITKQTYHCVYTFIVLLASKFCWSKQVNKRQAVNAVTLLSTVGNVVLEKNVQDIWWARLN